MLLNFDFTGEQVVKYTCNFGWVFASPTTFVTVEPGCYFSRKPCTTCSVTNDSFAARSSKPLTVSYIIIALVLVEKI